VVRADGKIIATNNSDLARLNPSGSLDSFFGSVNGSGSSPQVIALVQQPDGKLLVAGSFTQACHSTCLPPNDIARFNVDGSVDTTFDPGAGAEGGNDILNTLTLQPNGKIVVGGSFLTFNGAPRPSLARLNQDGALDTSFVPVNPNKPNFGVLTAMPVGTLALQLDGKIIVGSLYAGPEPDATPNRIFRLLADGSLDPSFKLGSGIKSEGRNVVTFALQADGGIVSSGNFNVVNGLPRLSLARLLPDNSIPTPTPICPSTAQTSDATVTFACVSQAGNTTFTPIDPAAAGTSRNGNPLLWLSVLCHHHDGGIFATHHCLPCRTRKRRSADLFHAQADAWRRRNFGGSHYWAFH
jgi:uncharacterized delta-60 repeat protein